MIPLYKPYMPNLPELESILFSGNLSYGKYGKLFEEKLKLFIGNKYLLTTNSYNSAINVLITVMGLKAGDSVVVSPMACLASTQPLLSFGLNIIWCDVLPKYGTLDPKKLEQILMKSEVKAIFHNHFAGIIGEIDQVNKIGRKYSVPVIDDGIEAFGGEYKGKKIGNVGSFATVFSFGPVRIPTTIDGGAITYQSEELYNIAKLVRDTGIDRSSFRDKNGEISDLSDVKYPGHSAMLDEIRSYIGYIQMGNIIKILEKQRSNALRWNNLSQKLGFHAISSNHSNFNYWVFPTLVDDKVKSMDIMRRIGIKSSSIHYPNHYYSVFGNKPNLDGVNSFYSKFLALPSGWWLKAKDFKYLQEIDFERD